MCTVLPIWKMVLISYSVINIIYRRYCRNGLQRKPCLVYSYITAYRRLVFLGLTRRSDRKYTIGNALEKGIGGEGAEWHKALRNGMEFNRLLLWVEGCKSCKVCKVFDVGGQATVERNGMRAWFCAMEWLSHLCCGVLRWVKWTKAEWSVRNRSEWVFRNECRAWNEMSKVNEPTASTRK